jgi:hypothetical protein
MFVGSTADSYHLLHDLSEVVQMVEFVLGTWYLWILVLYEIKEVPYTSTVPPRHGAGTSGPSLAAAD